MSIPKTLQEWLQSIPNLQMQKRSEQWLQLLCLQNSYRH